MTQEEKELLLKDLCARLHCGVICQTNKGKGTLISIECSFGETLVYVNFGYSQAEEFDLNEDDEVKPYLRPMSSMTEEERNEYMSVKMQETERVALAEVYRPEAISEIMDWLNAHHFDFRNLIGRGLALEAPEGMYEK